MPSLFDPGPLEFQRRDFNVPDFFAIQVIRWLRGGKSFVLLETPGVSKVNPTHVFDQKVKRMFPVGQGEVVILDGI